MEVAAGAVGTSRLGGAGGGEGSSGSSADRYRIPAGIPAGATGAGAASARGAAPAGGATMSSARSAAADCPSPRPGTARAWTCGPGAATSGKLRAVSVSARLALMSPACGPSAATGAPYAARSCWPGCEAGAVVGSGSLLRHHRGCAGPGCGACVRGGELSSRAGCVRSRAGAKATGMPGVAGASGVAVASGAAGESGLGPGTGA